jgi:sterol desaturase/sphingolipid hydroxylase (fatty acid hydroxylase superfamily)
MSDRSLNDSDSSMFDFLTPPQSVIDLLEYAGMWLGAALFLLLPIELWRRYRAKELTRQSWLEMLANLSTLVPTILVGGIVAAFVIWLFSSAAALAPWHLPVNIWTALAAIILVDAVYYADHRIGHRVRLMWAFSHSVHHSSPLYNQTTGLRISFVDGFISPWYYTTIILIGFDPLLVAAAFGFNLGYQQWIHTETIGKLGWFDWWFNSPSNHRVHHGSQPQYLDKNYGGILMIWDHLFGTYECENEKVVFGLTEPINSVNPWKVHFEEFRRLIQKFRMLKTGRAKMRLLFAGPDVAVTDSKSMDAS